MADKVKNNVRWVAFDNNAAQLVRFKIPAKENAPERLGLLLLCGDSENGREIEKRSLEAGFRSLRIRQAKRASFIQADENGKFSFSVKQLAEKLGGKSTYITKADMIANTFPRAEYTQSPVRDVVVSSQPSGSGSQPPAEAPAPRQVVSSAESDLMNVKSGNAVVVNRTVEANSEMSDLRGAKMEEKKISFSDESVGDELRELLKGKPLSLDDERDAPVQSRMSEPDF